MHTRRTARAVCASAGRRSADVRPGGAGGEAVRARVEVSGQLLSASSTSESLSECTSRQYRSSAPIDSLPTMSGNPYTERGAETQRCRGQTWANAGERPCCSDRSRSPAVRCPSHRCKALPAWSSACSRSPRRWSRMRRPNGADPTTPTRQRRHRRPLRLDTRGRFEKGSAAHDRRVCRHEVEKTLQSLVLVHCDPIDVESELSRQPTGSHRVGLEDGKCAGDADLGHVLGRFDRLSWVAVRQVAVDDDRRDRGTAAAPTVTAKWMPTTNACSAADVRSALAPGAASSRHRARRPATTARPPADSAGTTSTSR